MQLRTAFVLLAVGWGASTAKAQDPGMCRAGCPQNIRCWAVPSETRAYDGYYVGGGVACGGSRRHCDEGTWGWDYEGWLLPHRVVLYWSHGRRYQGGTGAYKANGPNLPDVSATVNAVVHKHGSKCAED